MKLNNLNHSYIYFDDCIPVEYFFLQCFLHTFYFFRSSNNHLSCSYSCDVSEWVKMDCNVEIHTVSDKEDMIEVGDVIVFADEVASHADVIKKEEKKKGLT